MNQLARPSVMTALFAAASNVAAVLLLLSACSCDTVQIRPWEVTEGMDAPESATLDPDSGFLFVTQVGQGAPNAKDGNGRISKLTLDGRVRAVNWVTGLNGPKGSRVFKGTLWVADIDRLVGIDIASGRITHSHLVEGAQFLNDVAVSPDGTVYVSDTLGSRIYQLKGGKDSVFAEGEEMEYPNGLLYEDGALVVAGWGKPEADFTTKVPGRLFKLDLATKKKTLITAQPTGNLDGLESDGDRGGYVVSDWMVGKVFHITADGRVRVLRSFKKGAADLAYLPRQKFLILPLMLENRVVAVDLSPEMK